MSSLSPIDFGEPCMNFIGTVVRPGEKPYTDESESATFKAWVVQPAQVAFAHRVHRKCTAVVPVAPTPQSTLAGTMKEYLEAQAATQKLSAKALSFKLAERVRELGLADFPKDALPSEETLAIFEAAGRVAREKGRLYVGSADGEDLQKNFRPAWSRVPRVDVPAGEGSLPERQRQMAEFKRARAASELDWPGCATFHAHVMDWGVKLILMKTATPVEILGYSVLLAKVAEEQGGVRTAYQYDLLARTAMAKALEAGDPSWNVYFTKIDRDIAKEAKDKIMAKFGEVARFTHGKGGSGKSKQGKADGHKGGGESSAGSGAKPPGTSG
eukprot:2322961-Pyramimonas_sp.AAC.1